MWFVLSSLLLAAVRSHPTPRASVCSPGFVKAANIALHITEGCAAVRPPPATLPHHTGRSPFLPVSRSYCYGKVALGVRKTTSEPCGLRMSLRKLLQMESKYCGHCGCPMPLSIIPSFIQSLLTLLLSTHYMPTHTRPNARDTRKSRQDPCSPGAHLLVEETDPQTR